MSPAGLSTLLPLATPSQSPRTADPAKVHDAAQQFESILLAQILRTARAGNGWMGTADTAGECATDFAEQQVAGLLARQGGFGLTKLIEQGLERGR